MNTVPRGIRDNNPGNLRPAAQKWLGEVEPDGNYCRFDHAENGIRALAKNLLAYQRVHGLRTIETMIDRWAPPSENNTPAYVNAVCGECNAQPTDDYDIGSVAPLMAMVKAIIRHENGQQPYADTVVMTGVALALA